MSSCLRYLADARDAADCLSLSLRAFLELRIPPATGSGRSARWDGAALVELYNAALESAEWSTFEEAIMQDAIERAQRRRPEWKAALRRAWRAMRQGAAR